MYFEPFITALIAALSTTLAGLFSTYSRREKESQKKQIESIAESVRSFQGTDKNIAIEINTINNNSPTIARSAIEGLISGYHEQALSQANAQFWFSVMAATVGFIWILYAGMDIRPENLGTTLKTLPGIVMDTVAFLFFRQAAETRQRATDLYDRLRKDKQISESITLVDSIEDIRVRSAVKAQMTLHMTGLEPSPINLTHFLSSSDHLSTPNEQNCDNHPLLSG